MRNEFIAKKSINAWTVFFAWIFILIVPLTAGYCALIGFINFSYDKAAWEFKSQISLEAEKFKKDILPSSYLLNKLHNFDTIHGFKHIQHGISDISKYENLTAKKLLKQIEFFSGLKVACLFYCGPDTNKVSFAKGHVLKNIKLRTPPSLLLKRLFGVQNEQVQRKIIKYKSETAKLNKYIQNTTLQKAKKDMQFFLRTVFGNIGPVNLRNKQITRTISSKLGLTGTTYVYYSEATGENSGQKTNLGGYIAIIRLRDLSASKIIKQATQTSFYKKLERQVVSPRSNLTNPDNMKPLGIHEFKIDANGIQLSIPLPPQFLVFLSQRGLFRANFQDELRSHFPLLRVFADSSKMKPPINNYLKYIKALFLLILLLGTTICVRLALFGINLSVSIKTKFTLGISISLLLPIAILFFSSSIHNSFSSSVSLSSLKNHMKNRFINFKTQLGNYIAKHEILNIELGHMLAIKIRNSDLEIKKSLQSWLLESDAEEVYLFRNDGQSLLVKHPKKVLKSQYSKAHTNFTKLLGNAFLSNLSQAKTASTNVGVANLIAKELRNSSSPRLAVNHLGELLSVDRSAPDSKFSFLIIRDINFKPFGCIIVRYSTQLLVSNFFAKASIRRQMDEIWQKYKITFNFVLKDRKTNKYDISLREVSQTDKKQMKLAHRLRKHLILEKNNKIDYFNPVETLGYTGIAKATINKSTNNGSTTKQIIKFGAYLFILFTLIMLLTHLFYVKPIHKISNQLLQITQGNLSHRCHLNTGDEFEELANSFNKMAKDIAQKEQLEKFVSKDVLDDMKHMGASDLKPGGDLIEASIVFCEINDFSTFSTTHSANEVIELLNKFISVASKVCSENKGVIDKIVEGSLLITFKTKDHALNACKTAMQVSLTMSKITSGAFNCHSGISTGKLISGKIGSRTGKLDFTVIGDTVNMAARLKSKHEVGQNTQILLSISTKERVEQDVVIKDLGDISIKGKQEKQQIYELIELT